MLMCLLHQLGITGTADKQRIHRQHILDLGRSPYPSPFTTFRPFRSWLFTDFLVGQQQQQRARQRPSQPQRDGKISKDCENCIFHCETIRGWVASPCLGQRMQAENKKKIPKPFAPRALNRFRGARGQPFSGNPFSERGRKRLHRKKDYQFQL